MAYFLNNPFIGFEPNKTSLFHTSDPEDLFLKNLKRQPKSWIWRTKEVEYKHNEYGHRCKNIKEINLDNYILFAGCSHTEGIGLPIENTYSYLLAKDLKKDYYNLSLAGCANDIIEYNLITWLATVEKKPDLIVIQPTSTSRFSSVDMFHYPVVVDDAFAASNENVITSGGPWNKDKASRDFVSKSRELKLDDFRTDLSLKAIETVALDIPIVYLFYEEENTENFVADTKYPIVKMEVMDQARDVSLDTGTAHAGIKSNKVWSLRLKKTITKNFENFKHKYRIRRKNHE